MQATYIAVLCAVLMAIASVEGKQRSGCCSPVEKEITAHEQRRMYVPASEGS